MKGRRRASHFVEGLLAAPAALILLLYIALLILVFKLLGVKNGARIHKDRSKGLPALR